jgi:hypothetical protein
MGSLIPGQVARCSRSPCTLAFACRQHEERLARAMRAAPLDLLQANVDIKWIKVVLVLVTYEFFIEGIGIVHFNAVLHVQQS